MIADRQILQTDQKQFSVVGLSTDDTISAMWLHQPPISASLQHANANN